MSWPNPRCGTSARRWKRTARRFRQSGLPCLASENADTLAKDHKTRNTADVQIHGLQFVRFEETAWDLALTTQALTYIDRDLALAISRVYSIQKSFNTFTQGMTQAMYVLPWQENFDGFASAAETYYGDAVYVEPKLIEQYDELIRRIDRARRCHA
jgi:hypothetical protein